MSLSRKPGARARQLANLKKAKRIGRHGKETPVERVPGMQQFLEVLNSAAEQNPNRTRSKIIQAALIEIARQTDSFNLLIYRP